MTSYVISFSGRSGGNCSAIARMLLETLSSRDEIGYFDFSTRSITPCGQCGYECFQARERCPYFDDPAFALYDAIVHSHTAYFIVPNYCDYPCANFFIFNERSQCYFQRHPELLDQYETVRKKFIVVSNTGQDNFTAAFQYHTGDMPPDILFLSARQLGKVSIHGDLMDSSAARDAVLHFIG